MTITIKFSDNIKHDYGSFEEILKLDNYNDVVYMTCNGNKLYHLPELPNSLIELLCDSNSLSSLPKLPNSLTKLSCWYNNLSSLPELPNSLYFIFYDYNPTYEHILDYFDEKTKKYFEYQKKTKKIFINKISNWFLDCKYNPKYLYCRQKLMKEYDELYN